MWPEGFTGVFANIALLTPVCSSFFLIELKFSPLAKQRGREFATCAS